MNKSDFNSGQKQKEDRKKFENATRIDTSVLTVKNNKTDRQVDLRSPDEFANWTQDPDELRERRKAARRAKAKKKKEE